jgi:hypothetical protein
MVLSSASNSVENAQSQAMTNDGYDYLGYISLAVLYLVLGIGCLFAPAIVARFGVKNSLIFGTFCDTLWILSNLFAAYS